MLFSESVVSITAPKSSFRLVLQLCWNVTMLTFESTSGSYSISVAVIIGFPDPIEIDCACGPPAWGGPKATDSSALFRDRSGVESSLPGQPAGAGMVGRLLRPGGNTRTSVLLPGSALSGGQANAGLLTSDG